MPKNVISRQKSDKDRPSTIDTFDNILTCVIYFASSAAKYKTKQHSKKWEA